MKTPLLLVCLTLAPLVVRGQGQVTFATLGGGVDAPVTNLLTGQRVPAGNTFLAQLFYGPAGITEWQQLISVTNAAVGFAAAGHVSAGTRYTDPAVVAGGQVGTFQVRVWEAVLGATWEQAYPNWIHSPAPGLMGWSALIQVKTTSKVSDPPASPAFLIGLPPIYLSPVPEPATAWLGILGAGVLLFWRTRRR